MEYYAYVSHTKVDMILPQIPKNLKTKLAAEVGINVGVLSAKVKTEGETGVRPDAISRLQAVVKYVQDTEEIGTIEEPKSWIKATQDLRIVYPDQSRQAVFFVGRSLAHTRFALGGSAAHLISRGDSNTTEIGWSFLPDMLLQLRSIIHAFENPIPGDVGGDRRLHIATSSMQSEWIMLVDALERNAAGPLMKASFLAKRILAGTHENRFKVVLATPLYVSVE